jgi:PKD repeat protein
MPSNGTAPLNAMFDVSASADPDSGDSVVSYVVDFGDGTTQTFTTPTFNHSYTSAGNYTPKLTVTDKQGLSSTQATSPVVVNVTAPVQGNTAPTASFKSVSPATGEASLTVSFDVSTSSDPDVGDLITSYIVDFGDGSTEVFTTSSFTHVYTKAGSYTPKLTVMDRNGATSVQVISATVVTVSATVVVAVKPVSVQTGRFGGGSLDFGVLLGLLLLARRRR